MSSSSRARQGTPPSPGRIPGSEAPRRQAWAGKSPQEVLARYRPGKADPMQVLDVLLALFNAQHTAREKTVSHKTRHERARFLRQFFGDLQRKAGFHTVPDPRNLGQKHVLAMVQVWQRGHDPDLPELPARPGRMGGQAWLRAQAGALRIEPGRIPAA